MTEPEWVAATEPAEPEPVDLEPAEDDTQPIRMSQPSEPVTAGEPLHPVTIGELLHQPVPAEAPWPAPAAWAARADRPGPIWLALGAALLVVAVLGGILLITGTGDKAARPAVAVGDHHREHRASGARPPSSGHSAGSPGRTRRRRQRASRPVRLLAPAGIAAFGPGGAGHGDSPQLARQALAGEAASPWHSAWYTTPRFGNLQPGTGLLVDMGRTVTITSAKIALGHDRGADLGLRIGNAPTLASLKPVAHADDTGGLVRLTPAPTRGRYVLVWFTRLPPDQAGTFQVSVSDIRLRGYS